MSEMKQGWETKKLEELGIITSSKRIYKSEYVKNGIPFYRTKEIKELSNGNDITLELFISKNRYSEIKNSFGIPQIGDLLMSAVGTIGEIMVIKNANEFYFKDGNILWFKEFKNLDTNFLKFALTAFVEEIKSLAIGSSYSALTIEKLNKYEINFPKSLVEQQKIVSILDEAFTAIDKAKANAEQNLKNSKELFESYLQSIFENKRQEWEYKSLGESCQVIMGQSPLGETYNTTGDGVPLINGPVEFGKQPFSETIKSKFTTKPTKYCKKNDLILCVRGSTTGKINIAGFDACIGRGVAAIRYSENQFWINYFILSSRKKIYSLGTGATFPNVSSDTIKSLIIPIPSLNEQKIIVQKLDALLIETKKLEAIYQQKINDLDELKKSILQKAFSGELITKEFNTN